MGGISSIGSCIDGLTLDPLGQRAKSRTQARPHPALPPMRGRAGWGVRGIRPDATRMRSGLKDRIVGVCLNAPLGKEIARRTAIKSVIEFREVVYALNRMVRCAIDH